MGVTSVGISFDQALKQFLTYLRVEAALAPATLEAYGRDLRDLVEDLCGDGVADASAATPEDLARHLRRLHRHRKLRNPCPG